MNLWSANEHQFGPGKIHIVDDENSAKTMCGKWLRAVPGKQSLAESATCQICLNAVPNREERTRASAEWAERASERERIRDAENAAWWTKYNAYLASPKWKAKSAAVIRRDVACRACGAAGATEAHHLTYAHVFDEPLFDLVGVCHGCHDRITAMDRERRASPEMVLP